MHTGSMGQISGNVDTPGLSFTSTDGVAERAWKTSKPFAKAGISGMGAWMFVQPIDIVKVRIQLGTEASPIRVANQIFQTEGVTAFYKGVSAGLLRQATYTTARIGSFNTISDWLKGEKDCLPLYQKAGVGILAGGIGAIVGCPADLTLVRMQADAILPEQQKRHYRGVVDAFLRISREEGIRGLYRGVGPTIWRAMALNMGMLASNDEAKECLVRAGFEKGSKTVILGGAMVAGFFAASCSLPFDFIKTRLQEMTRNSEGHFPYKGFVDCAMKTAKNEGITSFYRGFPTYCVRIAPSATLTLIFMAALPF